jgi:hypothetical protein
MCNRCCRKPLWQSVVDAVVLVVVVAIWALTALRAI